MHKVISHVPTMRRPPEHFLAISEVFFFPYIGTGEIFFTSTIMIHTSTLLCSFFVQFQLDLTKFRKYSNA